MKVGIIGGSGLYNLKELEKVDKVQLDTPFGKPSSDFLTGEVHDIPVIFIPRHGLGHVLLPTEIPFRANIWGLKKLGVTHLISVGAVGSLREEYRPLDMVVPNQIIDRTYQRDQTFFDQGVVAHIAFSDPFCPSLSELLYEISSNSGVNVHGGGTLVVMEGPAFSTRAESNMYRSWGADIIGMTTLPEAKLAREAEICYSTLACVTDYVCWREATEPVTIEMVVANLQTNVSESIRILRQLIPIIPSGRNCGCGSALQDAVLTSKTQVPQNVKEQFESMFGRKLV